MNDTQVQEEIKGKEKKERIEEIKKEDWEAARTQYASLLVNARINLSGYEYMLKICDEKIAEYDGKDEEVPEDIQDILK